MRGGQFLLLSALLPLACTAPGGGSLPASGFADPGPRSDTDETRRLRAKAESGDAVAQYSLAVLYFEGRGVPRNDAEAVRWFGKAAEQGRADAQYYFGEMYYQGRGVAQDFSEAASWYRRSAEQGYAIAQANLGTMSFDGQGVPKDKVEAYKWEILAVARAPDEKQREFPSGAREVMAKAMAPQEIADAEKRARAWVSARQITEDLVREMALQAFCGKMGEGPFFIEVDGGPPSATLLDRLRDPRYHPIAQAEMTQLEMSKNWRVSVPAHGSIVSVGAIEWQSDRRAKLRLGRYRGPLDAFAEDLLVERSAAGQWSVQVVPNSQVVS